jgi:uncharacterized circularly permuted ATP-grasp superfamily protein
MVVKAVGEAGATGCSSARSRALCEREEFRDRVRREPRNYIAQPVVQFSRSPCVLDGAVQPRHVDLRPFVLHGQSVRIVPAGSRAWRSGAVAGGELFARRRHQGSRGSSGE